MADGKQNEGIIMVPAVDFTVYTSNITLRSDLLALVPSGDDARVFKNPKLPPTETHRCHVFLSPVHDAWGIRASVKFLQEPDAISVANTIKDLLESEEYNVLSGSWVGMHSCNQVQDGVSRSKCITEYIWSK
jgi:hypothetical protein